MLRSATPMLPLSQPAPSPRLTFGSPKAQLGLLTQGLSALEKNPLAELLFKDVTAFNVPKIALSRTWKERWDTATLELSNSGITLLSSLFLPAIARWPVSKLANLSENYASSHYIKGEFSKVEPGLARKTLVPMKMARLGASFGFFFPFAAAFWAAPFGRNWLTMKRTQSANFESLIGFDGVKNHQPKRTLTEEMDYQRNTALKTLGIGLGLGAASVLGFGLMAKNLGKNLEGRLAQRLSSGDLKHAFEGFFKSFDLKGNQVNGQTATLVFWGLPAYLGWVHGARSSNERRERMIQSANAIFWFFFASKLTKPLWQAVYENKIRGEALQKCKAVLDRKPKPVSGEATAKIEDQLLNLRYEDILKDFKDDLPLRNQLLKLKNTKFALNDLGVPIVSLSAVQLFNFHLTERKIKAAHPQSQAKSASVQPAQQPAQMPVFPAPHASPLFSVVTTSPFLAAPKNELKAFPPATGVSFTSAVEPGYLHYPRT